MTSARREMNSLGRFNKFLRFNSIQTKLNVTILLLVVVPMILINLLYFRNSESFVQERMREANEQMLSVVGSRTESFIDEMVAASNTICFDSQLNRILAERSKSGSSNYMDLVKIEEVITRAQNSVFLNVFTNVKIFSVNGDVISVLSSPNESIEEFLKGNTSVSEIITKEGRIKWIAPHIKNDGKNDSMGTGVFITLGRLINGSGQYGILTISIDEAQFYRKYLSNINDSLKNEVFFCKMRTAVS